MPFSFSIYRSGWSKAGHGCLNSSSIVFSLRKIIILHVSPILCSLDLGFYFVLSLEQIIDFLQVVGPLGYSLRVALWRVTFLQMCLFSKYAHLSHHQQGRTRAPNDIALTSSYVSGGTVLLASNLSCKLSCLAMGLMSPTTFMLKKELARPLP